MAPIEDKSFWETYGVLLNLFYQGSSDSYKDLNGSKTKQADRKCLS